VKPNNIKLIVASSPHT